MVVTVPDWVRAYPQLLRSAVQVALTYRGRLMLLFTGALFPMLLLFVWLTVASESVTQPGWDTGRFVSYYLAAVVVHELTESEISWSFDADLRTGEFSTKLMRPVPVFHQYVAAEAGSRLVTVPILLALVMVLTIAFPMVAFPAAATSLVAAAIATLIAFLLGVLMASTFALVGFWTTQSANVYMLWWGVGAFVSGWIAPMALMPNWLQRIAELLPFRYALGFPVELALGTTSGSVAVGFAIAVSWLAVFAGLYTLLWRRGISHFQAVGG
jgi:ABC-2 type transport system permease protein